MKLISNTELEINTEEQAIIEQAWYREIPLNLTWNHIMPIIETLESYNITLDRNKSSRGVYVNFEIDSEYAVLKGWRAMINVYKDNKTELIYKDNDTYDAKIEMTFNCIFEISKWLNKNRTS